MPSDAELKAIFNAFDADGSGKIDMDELTLALAMGGMTISKLLVDDIVKQVDKTNEYAFCL